MYQRADHKCERKRGRQSGRGQGRQRRDGERTCSSFRLSTLMIRSSSASYALMRFSSRFRFPGELLAVDRRRMGGLSDIVLSCSRARARALVVVVEVLRACGGHGRDPERDARDYDGGR